MPSKLSVRFLAEAEADLLEAIRWYEAQRPGLGQELLLEVDAKVNQIVENPNRFPIFDMPYRTAHLSRFPFSLPFRVDGEIITVFAVMHQSRKPGWWLDRQQ